MCKKLFFLALLFLLGRFSYAHNDLHLSILELSQEIRIYPDSTALYLRRGELYTHHQEYKKAIRDFKICQRKGNTTIPLYLAFAECYQEQNKNRKALRKLNQLLKKSPKQIQALRMKGNILMKQKKYSQAAKPLEQVLRSANELLVENYLEAAEAYSHCKGKNIQEMAFTTLEKGIDDLGPLLLFYEKMKDMAMRNQDYVSAVNYQTEVINHSIRKEKPLYVRALLCHSISQNKKAKRDLNEAKETLENLPIRFQKTPAMKELNQQIQTLNKQLE